jgi:hypothetical protein
MSAPFTHEAARRTPHRVARQHAGGVAFVPAACVFGRGTVDGHPVVIAGDDFTLHGSLADLRSQGVNRPHHRGRAGV